VAPVRVVLVEDNDAFREAVELLVGLRDDVELVASLADGSEVVGVCVREAPDVLLLDYRLPGLDGVEVASAVRFACPEVGVVCLTAEISVREEEALHEAGVSECVTKDRPFDEVVSALKRAVGTGRE
jgi:DNA-binding NarL/FixJ family response regulator